MPAVLMRESEARMIRIAPPPLRRAALAGAFLLALPALAQEDAVTRRGTELRDGPAAAARSVTALPAGSPVTRLPRRQGAWVQVRTAEGVTGWMHLFDVGPATVGEAGGGVGQVLRGVTGLLGGATPARTATSASGIRGLDAEDLARAQPDAAAVGRMEALRQGEREAQGFAARAGLRATVVEPLPAPVAAGTLSADPAQQEAQ